MLYNDSLNLIEELYFGNICPHEESFDKRSRYAAFLKTISVNEEKLNAYFKAHTGAEEEQHLFSQLINAQGEIQRFSELNRFVEGFQLGARLMLDTFLLPQQSVIRDIY